MRQLTASDIASLKTATRALVQRVGGLHAAATVTRVGASALAEYYDPHAVDRLAPVDVVADLERVAAEPLVSDAMARLAGCTLQPMGHAAGSDARAIAGVFREVGQLGERWATAMEDGATSAGERDAVQLELVDLQRAVGAAIAVLRARSDKGEADG